MAIKDNRVLHPTVRAAIDEWHRTLPERVKLAEMIFGPEDESLVTSPVDYSMDEPDPGRTFLGGDYTIRPLRFRTGRRLAPGETSSTGLYAICDSRTGRTLRISMFRKVAEGLTGDDSRYIAECGIIP